MNYFIRQFGRPKGPVGKLFAGIMNISNKKMYISNAGAVHGCDKILEIGFGNGKQLKLLNKLSPSSELHGIDISEDMHELALKKTGKAAHLLIGRVEELPYPDHYFDGVISTDSCYFWTEPEKALSEIFRVMKSEGILVVSYNLTYAGTVAKSFEGPCLADRSTIISQAVAAGFEHREVRTLSSSEESLIFRKKR